MVLNSESHQHVQSIVSLPYGRRGVCDNPVRGHISNDACLRPGGIRIHFLGNRELKALGDITDSILLKLTWERHDMRIYS